MVSLSSAGEHPSGLCWIRRGNGSSDPTDTLAALFAGAAPADLKTFDFEGQPGVIAPHYHTEDIAAAIVSGCLAFDVGPGFADRLEFGPGDCLFLPAMLPHGEEVLGDEPVVAKVASLAEFETEEV